MTWTIFGFKILKFNILGGSRKMNSFWGMKKLWIFLGDHYIIGLIWGGGGGYFYTY